jgi:dTDP-4-amino-4,6-dideoxygalactose transaminase
VIEDAAQAIGAEDKGRRAGSLGHYGCFSFFPSKNLGGAGDGGMVTTNDPARAGSLTILRNHGMDPKYYHRVIGGNFRLDALQAAVVTVKLRHLDRWTADRQANARRYAALFQQAGLTGPDRVRLPAATTERHIFNQYVIRAPRRDALKAFLAARGVGTEVYYPVPLHLQTCFAAYGYRPGAFPESEKAAAETLALPIYPELTDAQAEYVVQCIAEFLKGI